MNYVGRHLQQKKSSKYELCWQAPSAEVEGAVHSCLARWQNKTSKFTFSKDMMRLHPLKPNLLPTSPKCPNRTLQMKSKPAFCVWGGAFFLGVFRKFYENTKWIHREEKREEKSEEKGEEKGEEKEEENGDDKGERSKWRRRRLGVRSSHINLPKKGLFRQVHYQKQQKWNSNFDVLFVLCVSNGRGGGGIWTKFQIWLLF